MPESVPGTDPIPLGPVQMWSIGFVGNSFKGEILPELERLKRLDIIRIIDMLVVRKDSMGDIAVLTASDLDWEEATSFGAYLGGLVGYGAGGLTGAQRGAMQGAAEMADGHIFDEQDAFLLEQTLANGHVRRPRADRAPLGATAPRSDRARGRDRADERLGRPEGPRRGRPRASPSWTRAERPSWTRAERRSDARRRPASVTRTGTSEPRPRGG